LRGLLVPRVAGLRFAAGFERGFAFVFAVAIGVLSSEGLFDAGPNLPLPALKPNAYPVVTMQSSPARVLIVEDDQAIAEVVQRILRIDGYTTEIAADGATALDAASRFNPDLVILDLGLPQIDGTEVARQMREHSDVPILVLTARDALQSKVDGLDAGADDYLVKPFEREDLLARLRALLRRRPPRGAASISFEDLLLNPDSYEVTRGDRQVECTQREFELLEYMLRNQRVVISRQQLLEDVWGADPFADTNTIEVFISNIRRKLELGGEPRILHTVRGVGYVIRV
jgi:DNA-binding response OmpR family regulator